MCYSYHKKHGTVFNKKVKIKSKIKNIIKHKKVK